LVREMIESKSRTPEVSKADPLVGEGLGNEST